jgi:hypothetical protein
MLAEVEVLRPGAGRRWGSGVRALGCAEGAFQCSGTWAAQNSLRSLRSLRSNKLRESVFEARWRARPGTLRASALPTSPHRLPAPGLFDRWRVAKSEFKSVPRHRRWLAGSWPPHGRSWKPRATSSAGDPRRSRGRGHVSPCGGLLPARAPRPACNITPPPSLHRTCVHPGSSASRSPCRCARPRTSRPSRCIAPAGLRTARRPAPGICHG